MMELPCTFILILASFVSATPHGYGVKGGASARAESSASAGAIGGIGEIPVPVPLGTGYSGSFSKSSSSSSSSASASSSSSSSAFSYSGSAANGLSGFGLNGGTQGSIGCSSGNCPIAGATGLPAQHGSAVHNTANAAATAGVGDVSGSGCQGHSCDNNSEKCASRQCNLNTQTGTSSIDSDTKKCASGQCGSKLQSGASPTENGLNDIRVVSDSTNSAYNSKDQSSNFDKTSSAYNSAGSDCSQGKCKASAPLSSKPNYSHGSENSYQGSDASSKQHSSSSNGGITSNYHKPATHLETPKIGSKCNSAGCNSGSDELGHETSPSSYNVHLHYDGSGTGQLLTTGKPSFIGNPSSTSCGGSNCFGVSSSPNPGEPSLTVGPGFINFGQSPSNEPAVSISSPYPTRPGTTVGSNVPSGHINNVQTNDGTKPTNEKLPVYNGGFGGPPGIFKPNEFGTPTGNPIHAHPSTQQHGSSFGSTPAGCNSPSCSGYPTSSGANAQSGTFAHTTGGQSPSNAPALSISSPYPTRPATTVGSNVPSGHIDNVKTNDGTKPTNEKLPVYTGGFGGPPGIFKPNEFGTPTSNPTHAHPSTQQHGPSFGSTATGCNSPSCSVYPTASGANAQSGTFAHTTGGGISASNEKLPTYTGGFGGPAGMLKPNEFDIHAVGTNKPSATHPASSSHNTQPSSVNVGASGCKTANCGGHSPTVGATSSASAPTGLFGGKKPSTDISSPSEKLPTYTGGFGGPGGLLKPNEYDIHTTVPTSPSGTYNRPSSSNSAGCSTPNCYPSNVGTSVAANAQAESFGVPKPGLGPQIPSVALPAYTSGYKRPTEDAKPNEINAPVLSPSFTNTQSPSSPGSYSTGCKTVNCAPASGAASNANVQTGSFGINKPNSDINPSSPNVPHYTGSFSGPSGILKPSENSYPLPSSGSSSTGCKTLNCGTSPTAGGGAISGANAQSRSFALSKPSGSVNPSNEKLPAYTGGFGGASGLLKPNEYTVPVVGTTPQDHHNPLVPTGITKPVACSSGNCNPHGSHGSAPHAHPDASHGVHAAAAATADANAVVYTGGFGGPPGVLQPFDDGKIGATPINGGLSHGSQIGAHHSSPNANIHSAHNTNPGAISGTTANAGNVGQVAAHANTAAQAGSIAGSTAYSGAVAGAASGSSSYGYNTQGSQYNQAGNIQGGSPCGGGCGGPYSGGIGANFDLNGGHGKSTAGATAKSLAAANAFGIGGNFGGSSATAHASAGAYTKGGYGKR